MGIANPVCRYCGAALEVTMVDLGMHPLCESFIHPNQAEEMEPFYPLHVRVCGDCFLAQIGEYVAPEEIFDDYAYYSSFSSSWLDHAARYVDLVEDRFDFRPETTRVVEIASNDGYLLRNFVERGYEVLGIEPAANVAQAAISRGIPTLVDFFNDSLASQLVTDGLEADLLIGNNVMAHTPDIHGFVAGIKQILAPDGIATFEFPHLMRLIQDNQFDTIYHEHWSYLSLGTVCRILGDYGLEVFDVEELWTHGGSLRIFVKNFEDQTHVVTGSVDKLVAAETEFGLFNLATYSRFANRVAATKRQLLSLLIAAKEAGDSVAIYGAAGKGNTLLNYCGIGTDFIDFACDRNPYKHGRFTPGTRIPIFDPRKIEEEQPGLVLILPWNLRAEIMDQLAYIGDWGGRFIVPIPEPRVVEAGRT